MLGGRFENATTVTACAFVTIFLIFTCSRNNHPSVRLAAGSTGAAIPADHCTTSGRRSRRRRLSSLIDCAQRQKSGGALGNSLDVPTSCFDAQIIVYCDCRRCSQCCRRRSRPRSCPHFISQGARSQTSDHGRQAALLCFSVWGLCCRQSGWGLAQLRPPCAD